MVAQHVVLLARILIPHLPVGNGRAVQADKVTQLYQELYVFMIGCIDHCLHAFQSVRDVLGMQIGNNGETYGLYFLLRAGKETQCNE